MIIGIFGDSFAVDTLEIGWGKVLATKYHRTVVGYAEHSSSLFWSYLKLIKHIDEIDQVIFVATSQSRLYYPDDELQAVSTLWTVEAALAGNLNHNKINISNEPIFKAAKQYYMHLCQPDFNAYVHDQIIRSIQELCLQKNKKLILIPAFDENIKYQTIFSFSLFEIMSKELEATFGSRRYYPETNMRSNHMTPENNKRLAKIINDLLQGNSPSVSINDFEFKKEPDPELHWKL